MSPRGASAAGRSGATQGPRRTRRRLPLLLTQGPLFFLPLAVGGLTLIWADHEDARATADRLAWMAAALLGLLLALRLAFAALERRAWARSGLRSTGVTVAYTGLGWSVLVTSALLLALDLVTGLGSMAVVAVAGFALVDLAMVAAGAAAWRQACSAGKVAAEARIEPAVVSAGDAARLSWSLEATPPPGFFLRAELSPPPGLAGAGPGSLRIALDSRPSGWAPPKLPVLELPALRRGLHRPPPPRAELRDLFGLTRQPCPWPATGAFLEVLPAVPREAHLEIPPGATTRRDRLARAHRRPDQDLFRFREYTAGDDTRRIHWRHSLKHGRLILRQPESREVGRRLALVLDTYLPGELQDRLAPGDRRLLERQLDHLVAAWLAVARHLARERLRTELFVPAEEAGIPGTLKSALAEGDLLAARRLGAGAAWQGLTDLDTALPALEARGVSEVVVLSARLAPWPTLPTDEPFPQVALLPWEGDPKAGGSDVPPEAAEPSRFSRFFLLPHPVGSPANALSRRFRVWRERRREKPQKDAAGVPPADPAVLSRSRAEEATLRAPGLLYEIQVDGALEEALRVRLRPAAPGQEVA